MLLQKLERALLRQLRRFRVVARPIVAVEPWPASYQKTGTSGFAACTASMLSFGNMLVQFSKMQHKESGGAATGLLGQPLF
jgi:hypothetical protein